MAGDRITLLADSKETVLADWEDVVMEGADVAPSSEFDVIRYFRGSKVKVVDRGNESVVLQFIVTAEWGDVIKAFDSWINCRSQTPRFGTLTWITRTNRGKLSRYIVDCGVQVKPVQRLGVITRIQYTIIGGEITTQPPTNTQ